MSDTKINPFSKLATDGVRGLSPYVPGKPVEELERELGISESVKLASNENPLGASPLGTAAALKEAKRLNLYPDDTSHRLREKLSTLHQVSPDQVLIGAGSSDVLDRVARSFLGPGVNAVYSAHSFAMYAIYTQAVGAESRGAQALPADHPKQPYGHDLDAMAEFIDDRTRVVFIANPHNPAGSWLARDHLQRFLDQLPSHVVVVLDEAYTEYVQEAAFPNGMEWLDRYPNLMVTRTFSKIYGLAGLRIGYGVASAHLVSIAGRVRHPFNANSMALAAAEAALDDVDFIQRSVAVNSSGLVQIAEGVSGLGLRFVPSVANFVLVDIGRPARDIYDALLRAGVIVRPVANYQLPNHLRVSVGTQAENEKFLAATAQVLKR
jgi:histidinol-phosphate aminotransferase